MFPGQSRERPSRYARQDLAIGIYTGERFLRTRAAAMRDTFLARHPDHRVFFYTGVNDSLGIFDSVAVENAAAEDYHSALHKQIYALQVRRARLRHLLGLTRLARTMRSTCGSTRATPSGFM